MNHDSPWRRPRLALLGLSVAFGTACGGDAPGTDAGPAPDVPLRWGAADVPHVADSLPVDTFEPRADTPRRPADASAGPDAAVADVVMTDSGPAGPEDAAHPVDTGPPGVAPGSLVAKVTGQTISGPEGVRTPVVTWDPASSVFVVAYGYVVPDSFRTRVVALRWDGALVASPSLDVEGVTETGQYSLEREIAARDDGPSSLLLVLEDDRIGNASPREIWGQPLTAGGAPSVAQAGPSFRITDTPDREEYAPAVAWERSGGTFFVTYSDDRDVPAVGPEARHLFGKTVAPDGTLGPEVRVGGESYWQMPASVAGSEGSGRFLVAYGDYDLVGGTLDCGYRARLLDATTGEPIGGPIELARIGNTAYERPTLAWSQARLAWLVVWGHPKTLRTSWVALDGTVLETGVVTLSPADGAGVPRVVSVPATGGFALGYHAWETTDAFVQELDGLGHPAGPPKTVNLEPPWLGTFYNPVAAAGDAPVVIAVPSLNWATTAATVFGAP